MDHEWSHKLLLFSHHLLKKGGSLLGVFEAAHRVWIGVEEGKIPRSSEGTWQWTWPGAKPPSHSGFETLELVWRLRICLHHAAAPGNTARW